MKEKIRAHILVSGIVQGVFFRANTAEKARELSLLGWVKNLPDGRVEAVFEGEKEKIEEIIDWLKSHPGMSKVEKVEVDWQEAKGDFENFEIRY